MFSPDDHRWMTRSLALAERGRTDAHPNPLVGSVVVRRGKSVGEGWHAQFGGAHAEAAALRRAGARARGGTLYVTLEPCHRWGKTPPCTQAVARAGLRRVVVGAMDPSSAGGGAAALRRVGLTVVCGLNEREVRRQNAPFFRRLLARRPHVVLKTAQTLDGKIASRTGASRWITGPAARRLGHRLRAQSDAVLVGGETVRRDNPALTAHGRGPDPLRVILSASLVLSPRARVFRGGAPVWVVTGAHAPADRVRRVEETGALVLRCPGRGGVDVPGAFRHLADRGIAQVLVEGGGRTAAAVLEAGLADEAYVFVAPSFLGGAGAPTGLAGKGWPSPAAGPRLKDVGVTRLGDDVLVHGWIA